MQINRKGAVTTVKVAAVEHSAATRFLTVVDTASIVPGFAERSVKLAADVRKFMADLEAAPAAEPKK